MAVSGRVDAWALPAEPLVSIVTPSYNQAAFIGATIESVLAQEYPCIEYLVIDGASSDETLTILQRYDRRLRWISEPDQGQADAINKGWRSSRGQILAWLNSDDLYFPGAVRAAVAALQSHPDVAAVYGDCVYIDQSGQTLGQFRTTRWNYAAMLASGAGLAQQATFFRREALFAVNLLDPALHMAMDLDLWLRLGLHYSLQYVPQRFAAFRIHSQSKTVAHGQQFSAELQTIYQRFFAQADLPPALRKLQRQAFRNVALQSANYHFMAGDLLPAQQFAWQSIKLAPLAPSHTALKILLLSASGRHGWYVYRRIRDTLVPRLPFLSP